MPNTSRASDEPVAPFALAKMVSVLGEDRARQLYHRIVDEPQRPLVTADDLFAVAGELRKLGGFEAAVGAMLQVNAVMRGARGR